MKSDSSERDIKYLEEEISMINIDKIPNLNYEQNLKENQDFLDDLENFLGQNMGS